MAKVAPARLGGNRKSSFLKSVPTPTEIERQLLCTARELRGRDPGDGRRVP